MSRHTWNTLPNPFFNRETSEVITTHISGRARDIRQIIMGQQSAIILAGAPGIGKSAFVRYLQRRPNEKWSWRNELAYLQDQLCLKHIHFVAIDLTALKESDPSKALEVFVHQCYVAIEKAIKGDEASFATNSNDSSISPSMFDLK